MERYESPIKLPDEYFRLIGIIAAQWERVEYTLEWAIAEIGGHKYSKVGLFTANIGFRSKCDLVLVYARFLEKPKPDEWKAIKKAVTAIADAYTLRNKFVHAKWMPPKKKKDPVKRSVVRTAGGKLSLEDKVTTIKELEEAAAAIHSAGDGFFRLMQSYGIMKARKRRSTLNPRS